MPAADRTQIPQARPRKPMGPRGELFVIDDIEATLREHAVRYGIPMGVLYARRSGGMSTEEALKKPYAPNPNAGNRYTSMAKRNGEPLPSKAPAPPADAPPEATEQPFPRMQAVVPGGRTAKLHTANGIRASIKDHAERAGIAPTTIHARVRAGMDLEAALALPSGKVAKLHMANGIEATLKQHAERAGIPPQIVHARRSAGMSLEEALAKPYTVRGHFPNKSVRPVGEAQDRGASTPPVKDDPEHKVKLRPVKPPPGYRICNEDEALELADGRLLGLAPGRSKPGAYPRGAVFKVYWLCSASSEVASAVPVGITAARITQLERLAVVDIAMSNLTQERGRLLAELRKGTT